LAKTRVNTPGTMFPNSGGVNRKAYSRPLSRLFVVNFRIARHPPAIGGTA